MSGALGDGGGVRPGEPGLQHHLKHVDRRQQGRHQQGCEAHQRRPAADIHRRPGNVPLADEAIEGGDPRQGAGRRREAGEGHRHVPGQALQLGHILPVGVMQHRTGREEGHDLYHRVDDQVQEGRCQGLGGHQGGGKQNIRQVRHRGVSQPQLEVPLLQGHAGAVYNGDDGQQQRQLLGPGAGQNVRAEAVIDQADTGEGAGPRTSSVPIVSSPSESAV